MVLRAEISLREWLDTRADKSGRAAVALIAGILVVLFYAATRFIVYWMFPIDSIRTTPEVVFYEPGQYEWWVRDTIMDVPRLVALCLALWVGRYFWGLKHVGWHARLPVRGLIGGAVVVLLVLQGSAFRAMPA